jgi:starvation-inducible DNA-binding protein
MATTTHLPPLGTHQRDEVGAQLQSTLVELVELSLLGKQLHWSIVGPFFRSLHLELDVLVDSWRELADTVAERAVALGSFPGAQAPALATAEIARIERGPIEDVAVVAVLADRLAQVVERIRGRMERLGEIDLASQDVLIEVIRELEKQLWMIRSQAKP